MHVYVRSTRCVATVAALLALAACASSELTSPAPTGPTTTPRAAPGSGSRPNAWNDEGAWSPDSSVAVGSAALALRAAAATDLERRGATAEARALRAEWPRDLPANYAEYRAAMVRQARLPLAAGSSGARTPTAGATPSESGHPIDPLVFYGRSTVAISAGSSQVVTAVDMSFAGDLGTMEFVILATGPKGNTITWSNVVHKLGWRQSPNHFVAAVPVGLPAPCGYSVQLTTTHTARNYFFIPVTPIFGGDLFEVGQRAVRGSSAGGQQPECPCPTGGGGGGGGVGGGGGGTADYARTPLAAGGGLTPRAGGAAGTDSGAHTAAGAAFALRQTAGGLLVGLSRVAARGPGEETAAATSPRLAGAPSRAPNAAGVSPRAAFTVGGGCAHPSDTGAGGGGSGGGTAGTTYCVVRDWYDGDGNFIYTEIVTCWWQAA